MSFDIFLVCLNKGHVSTFPRVIIEKAFASFIESRSDRSWKLVDSLADVWIDDNAETGGFMVSRPPGDDNHPFWHALLEVMRQTQTVLHWPSAGPKPYCVVADESVIAHMPPDMIEILGTPKIVRRPAEFWEFIIDSDA